MHGRRLWWAFALVGLTVLLAAGAFVLWPQTDRVTSENLDLVTLGMPRSDAYAILGPPGNYASGPVGEKGVSGREGDFQNEVEAETWYGDDCIVSLQFAPDGTVHAKAIEACNVIRLGPLDSLLWKVKRRWAR